MIRLDALPTREAALEAVGLADTDAARAIDELELGEA